MYTLLFSPVRATYLGNSVIKYTPISYTNVVADCHFYVRTAVGLSLKDLKHKGRHHHGTQSTEGRISVHSTSVTEVDDIMETTESPCCIRQTKFVPVGFGEWYNNKCQALDLDDPRSSLWLVWRYKFSEMWHHVDGCFTALIRFFLPSSSGPKNLGDLNLKIKEIRSYETPKDTASHTRRLESLWAVSCEPQILQWISAEMRLIVGFLRATKG
jgi:hypothetical protein